MGGAARVAPELEGGRLVWPRLTVAVVVGLLFGTTATLLNTPLGDYVLDDNPRRVASLVANSGAAWAGSGVLGGWLLGSALRGLAGGPVALVAAVVAYYLLGAVVGSETPDGSAEQIALFSLIALVAGPVLGVVGGAIRRRGALGLMAALVVPLGACAEQIWRSSHVELQPDPARPTANVVLLALALAGAAVAVARYARGRRSRRGRTSASDVAPE